MLLSPCTFLNCAQPIAARWKRKPSDSRSDCFVAGGMAFGGSPIPIWTGVGACACRHRYVRTGQFCVHFLFSVLAGTEPSHLPILVPDFDEDEYRLTRGTTMNQNHETFWPPSPHTSRFPTWTRRRNTSRSPKSAANRSTDIRVLGSCKTRWYPGRSAGMPRTGRRDGAWRAQRNRGEGGVAGKPPSPTTAFWVESRRGDAKRYQSLVETWQMHDRHILQPWGGLLSHFRWLPPSYRTVESPGTTFPSRRTTWCGSRQYRSIPSTTALPPLASKSFASILRTFCSLTIVQRWQLSLNSAFRPGSDLR